MMKNSILFFSLLAGMFLFPPNGVASYKSTHTSTPKPEPAFQFEQPDKAYKTAAVCFLGIGDCDNESNYATGGSGESYDMDTVRQCQNEGFILNNCNSVQVPEGYCPYNKSYITRCKCASNLVTCPAGQVGVGESCGGKYTQCTCPTGVSAGAYGCEEYYPAPCNTVCKKAYADNCRNRTAVSANYGCQTYWSDGSTKCQIAKKDNCDNRTTYSCIYGCEQYWSDCPSKCQKCYVDNCLNVTSVNAPYGCKSYFADCPSKCEVAYSDNCHNRTDVSHPYGCSKWWSDCPSKCQTCKGNPDCDVSSLSCSYGCANTNSCGKCTACKTNPDCDVTSKTCSYGCATTNSCGKCTGCKGNPDCDVAAKSCSQSYFSDCSSKCQTCKSCNYSSECLNYTLSSSSSCSNGSLSCTACGITKYRCKPSLSIDGTSCPLNGWTNCNGRRCCCRSGESCSGPRYCLCQASGNDLIAP